MVEVTTQGGAEKPRRKTGDWRGLPTVLTYIAVIGSAVGIFSVIAAFADSSSFRTAGAVGADWIIAGYVFAAALSTYAVAAIIAALRGILNR